MRSDMERTYRIRAQTIWATVLLCAELVVAVAGGIWMLFDQETELGGALRALGFVGGIVWGTWAAFLRPRVVLTAETVRVVNVLGGAEFAQSSISRADFSSEGGLVFRLKDGSEHSSFAFSGGRSAAIGRPRAEKLLADLKAAKSEAAGASPAGRGEPRRFRSWAAIGSGLLMLGTLAFSFVA